MLDLKLLTTFREVAVRGSFSEAAVALDFTQPAVSQHISRLESALGTRVLERSARGVTLTPAGEVLVRHASALLDAARRAEEAVRDAAGIGRAQVRVGAFASAAAGLLPGATRELRARRPDAELTLVVLEDEQAVDALLAGRVRRRGDRAVAARAQGAAGGRGLPADLATTRCGSRSRPTIRSRRARRSRWKSCATSRGWSRSRAARAPTPTSS